MGFQIAARGKLKVKAVTLEGKTLRRSQTHGYDTWHDVSATFFVVALRVLARGKKEITVAFR